jgi:CDP-4-dehydro-6-deoxyglucose reductase, E1
MINPYCSSFRPGVDVIPPAQQCTDQSDIDAIVSVAESGKYASGWNTPLFEKNLAKAFFPGKQKALLVNSGSSANLLAVETVCSRYSIRHGHQVITTAAGFPTTVAPLIQKGIEPIYIDVDLKTLTPQLKDIENAFDQGEAIRGIFMAHPLGNPYRADEIATFCNKWDIFLIEDCCDALGAEIGNSYVGTFGDLATLSFYPAHHLSMGEGGALLAFSETYRKLAESFRDWGRDCYCAPGMNNTCGKRFDHSGMGDLPDGYDHKYVYSQIGYNLKATEFQAALGLSQLAKAHTFIEMRRLNWQALYDGVKASPLLSKHLIPVEPTPGTTPSWFGFPMHCEGIPRVALLRYLEAHKIGTRLLFAGNITKQPAYIGKGIAMGSLPNTDYIMRNTFWIGVHPGIDAPRITYMLEQLEKGIRHVKKTV